MRTIFYFCLGLVLFQVFPFFQFVNSRPTADNEDELPEGLQSRLSDTISELEWLLHQLVNILTDMVTGAEKDPTLLKNQHFRQILIQVIKRIDIILEHFEYVGPSVLTEAVMNELKRINCVRIRLANYISQSKKYDVSMCFPPKPDDSSKQTFADDNNNQTMFPMVTQIVSLLVQILNQLGTIHHEHHDHHHGNGGNSAASNFINTTPSSVFSNTITSINWDDLMSQFASSNPVKGSSGKTTTINWNNVFGSAGTTAMPTSTTSSNSSQTTQNWNDLISQVMGGMGGTLLPTTTASTLTSTSSMGQSSTMAWEDAMNDLIGQWNQSMANNRPPSSSSSNQMNVQQCVDSILSLISAIQSQLPTIPSRNYYGINGKADDSNTSKQQLEQPE